MIKARRIGICGGLLIGVSIYQAEFDFGVPQFRMVFEPAMIALASGFALVVARLWVGRGGALLAATFFLVVRGLISIWTGPIMGQTTPMVPLYFAEAASVEVLGLLFASQLDRGRAVPGRLLAFGAAAGAAARRSDSRRSGASPTSTCRSPGRRTCSRKASSWRSRPGSQAACWAACWPPACEPSSRPAGSPAPRSRRRC